MATNSMVPYSNPAGNNQTTPNTTVGAAPLSGVVPASPTSPSLNPAAAATANPLVPTGAVVNPILGDIASPAASGNQLQQLTDIYGQGTGTSLFNLENSVGGTNSATIQEYIASLQPQEASAQAGLNAQLGASGVNSNSSVAAIGDASLQANEFAAISNETANLTQSGQQLEANLIQGTESASAAEVAYSPLNVLGQVLGDVGQVAGDVMGVPGIGSMLSSASPMETSQGAWANDVTTGAANANSIPTGNETLFQL